jgi:hypothetical protein
MGSYNDTKYNYYVEAQIGSGPSVEEPKWALNADWYGDPVLAPLSSRLARTASYSPVYPLYLCQLQGRVTTRGLAD